MKTTGRTTSTASAAATGGSKPYPVDNSSSWRGQDVKVVYQIKEGHPRTVVGKFVGVAQRHRTNTPPDVVLASRSGNLTIISTLRIISINSTMEGMVNVWEMNPMELARVAYEAFRDRTLADGRMSDMPEWLELPYWQKEVWMASSEAVRDAVSLGA